MRVIIDADPGNGIPGADIDDALAIGLAVRSPEITVEAITVVGGNVPVEVAADCAFEVLDAAGVTSIPVYQGAARPLVQDPTHWRTRLNLRRADLSAQALWNDVPLPRSQPHRVQETPAAKALVDLVNARPGEITIVGIGPLTNIATAMLIDPGWAAKVARLVLMCGAFDMPNVLHELNAAYDPEATHVVLSSSADLTLIPLDVTTKTFLRLAELDRLDASGTRLGEFLGRTCRPWVSWLAHDFGLDGCALHDPLALATVLDPTLVQTRTASVAVELQGSLTRGRMVAWDPEDGEILQAGLHLPTSLRPAVIATDVDNSRFMPLLLDRICA
ncbi:MAG: nucleoside hydrolase [Pseudonocardiales bacterium]|nr:nucleoside hydrolase [Pseudonocardiales bacterium]